MIAATDPQEFVPSGRQHVLRHPGPVDFGLNKGSVCDDFLLNRFEKVSIAESEQNEWWLIRKSPVGENSCGNGTHEQDERDFKSFVQSGADKSHSEVSLNHSWSWKSEEDGNVSNRLSDKFGEGSVSKSASKRLSSESDLKADWKPSNKFLGLSKEKVQKKVLKTKLDLGFVEEELYVKGNVVVWSKGLVDKSGSFDNARTTICSYCSQFPIKQALWCTFHCERPNFDPNLVSEKLKSEKPSGNPMPSVCIVDSQNIQVFTNDNEDFVNALPFPVNKIWNTNFGIFLEKQENILESDTSPKLFSLAHPLEEVTPVALNHSNLQLFDNYNLQVVFTNEAPSIAVVYNSQTAQHSVYSIRKLKNDEWVYVPGKYPSRAPSNVSIANKLKIQVSMWDTPKSGLRVIPSPMSSRPTSIASFCSVQPSRSHSSMAAISRCQSPAVSPLVSGNSWLTRPHIISSLRNVEQNFSMHTENTNTECAESFQLQNPVVCLDHVWTESSPNLQHATSFTGPASKVFLCDDMTGQWYLCFLMPAKSQLTLLRVDFSNPNNFTFGILTSVSAKDALPIPHLHMLAILEHSGNVILYSGLTIVGKLHVGGVLTQHTPSPLVKKSLQPFNSPFPRRSSLLPHCKDTPVLNAQFDEHLLSPVLPRSDIFTRHTNVLQVPYQLSGETSGKVVLSGLRDSVENRLTLQYSDGSYYRVILPPLASAQLIEDCINALQQTLQQDAAISLLSRWYATRNSPGPSDFEVDQEWKMFMNLLLELIGYEDEHTTGTTLEHTNTPSAKRQKQSHTASETDWKQLCATTYHKTVSSNLKLVLNLQATHTYVPDNPETLSYVVNGSAVLFRSIKIIHYTLHLLYEELKLNRLRNKDLPLLGLLLSRLANDLNFGDYAVHYWKDFPDICKLSKSHAIRERDLRNVSCWTVMAEKPFYVMQHLFDLVKGLKVSPFPCIDNVNPRTRDIVQLYGVLVIGTKNPNTEIPIDMLTRTVETGVAPSTNVSTPKSKTITIECCVYERVVLLMTEMNITTRVLDTLPPAISMFLCDILWMCRENPPSDWTAAAYYLLWRPDLAAQSQIIEKDKIDNDTQRKYGIYSGNQPHDVLPTMKQVDADQDDGMEDVDSTLLKLRFPDETRVAEARRLLQSSKPVTISLVQRPDVSDHEFIEEQEKHLFAVCTRTMALPVGRGMFTLRTATPVITEPLQIPPLCLTGKSPVLGTTIELTHIEMPTNINLWPLFHNGVANGLRIAPDAQNIDTNWITFNKPKNNVETQMEHAGFLMALGLNGHLRNLAVLSTYNYLVKLQEMTSVGVLLGLSAAFRGTSHSGLTKTLSIHVEALLPPTSMELDVPQNLQVAALLGIGLVYEATGHRHMTEVLLTEIGRPPGPEMENSVDRESYSLAAGLALGLVTLKQGGRLSGLADLDVPDLLHYYMVGGNKRTLLGSQKDKYKVASFQIREGSTVNLDVTSPGATLALGLMYLDSGNKAVADWMAPPETQYLLDFVRPDFLMLRVLARALIMWSDIKPSEDWVEKQFPESIRPYCMTPPSQLIDVDYEAMNQVYCNIVAGACFAIGLKYAGTADESAFRTLLHYCHMFTSLTAKSISELAGKPTIETCLNVTLISAAMVMAGTGNLDIMRVVRHLRRRVGVTGSAFVTYGSHLMTHMALGLLFLGGGRYTLSNSPNSVALLICAFYPKFPTHSNDNRYHLQAFRHLYVLAAEPRIVIPKEVSVGGMCYAQLRVTYLNGQTTFIRGPGIVPDLNTLSKLEVHDERYWPVVFERGRNWEQLQRLLSTNGIVEVKQRAGCLSYMEDKMGYHSQLARTLTQSDYVPWDPPSKAIMSFTSECTLRNFCDNYLNPGTDVSSASEARLRQMLTRFTYDCITKDKLAVLPIFAALVKVVLDLRQRPNGIQLWQLKLASAQVLGRSLTDNLVSGETVLALVLEAREVLESWEEELGGALRKYVAGEVVSDSDDAQRKLVAYVTFYDVRNVSSAKSTERVLALLQNDDMTVENVSKVLNVL